MKKFFISIINFFLFFFLLILTVIISIKEVTIETVYNTEFTSVIKNTIQSEYPQIDNIEDDEIKKIIAKYIDMITNNEDINIKPEIEAILAKYNLTDQQKKEILTKVDEHNEEIVTTIKKQYEPTSKQKILLSVYNYLNSKTLKTFIFSIIVFLFVLMIILQKSLYEWMMKLGLDFLIIGASLIMILPKIINNISHIKISVIPLTNIGGKYASVGLFLLLIYIIISININIIKKRKQQN